MPSVAGLAAHTSLSERSVQYALRQLEEKRIIRTTPQPGRCSQFEFLDNQGQAIVVPALRKVAGAHPVHPTPATPAPPGARGAPPTPATTAPKADPDLKQTNKQTSEAGARELLPHERAELRKELEPPTGTRPVGLFEFRQGWKPKDSHRAYGRELGLTDAEMLDRAEHCKLKLYDHPFPNEDKQFRRELLWLRTDKQTRQAREQRKANPHGFDEKPGARRSAGETPPDPIFGPGAGRRRAG